MTSQNFFKRYLVILADKRIGKFFTIHMDELEMDGGQVFDDVPSRVKSEDGKYGKVGQHVQDHVHHHLKNVGEKAMEFLINKKIKQLDGVIIGGHKQFLSQVKHCLPSKLQHKVIGELVTDMHNTTTSLTQKVLQSVLNQKQFA
jgi:peptide subunit release factor 1 (eRF1)